MQIRSGERRIKNGVEEEKKLCLAQSNMRVQRYRKGAFLPFLFSPPTPANNFSFHPCVDCIEAKSLSGLFGIGKLTRLWRSWDFWAFSHRMTLTVSYKIYTFKVFEQIIRNYFFLNYLVLWFTMMFFMFIKIMTNKESRKTAESSCRTLAMKTL